MNNTERTISAAKMEVTVKGHKVTLHFADELSPDVAVQVKQVLLSTCLLAADCKTADKNSNISKFR